MTDTKAQELLDLENTIQAKQKIWEQLKDETKLAKEDFDEAVTKLREAVQSLGQTSLDFPAPPKRGDDPLRLHQN